MAMRIKPRPPYESPPKVLNKTARLKAISKNRRVLKALCDPSRKDFVEEAGACMVCRQARATDCHEIIRGEGREAAFGQPQLWMALCRTCHDALDDASEWPVERQIMCRMIWEFESTVRLANICAGQADTGYTVEECLTYSDWSE